MHPLPPSTITHPGRPPFRDVVLQHIHVTLHPPASPPCSETTVEFASCVRNTCVVSIDVHGLILTDFFAYARTIQETRDGQTKRVVTSTERRNNHNSEPLVNVQESNVPFRALNNIIPLLPLHRLEPTPSANLWPVQFAPKPTPSAIP